MIHIEQGVNGWVPFPDNKTGWTARLTCPLCGFKFMLTAYVIDQTGIVSPSVDCLGPKCRKHIGKIRLIGFPPIIMPDLPPRTPQE